MNKAKVLAAVVAASALAHGAEKAGWHEEFAEFMGRIDWFGWTQGDGWAIAGVGFWPVWEWPGSGADVRGLRLNVVAGRHRNVVGLDFGTLVNVCDEACTGLAFAGICNVVGDSAWAAQFAAACNYSHHDARGIQLSLVNWCDEDMGGVQLGCANLAGDFGGLQLGVMNSAESGGGMQMGVVNVSSEFTGVQFGLLNLNMASGVPVLPFLNARF